MNQPTGRIVEFSWTALLALIVYAPLHWLRRK